MHRLCRVLIIGFVCLALLSPAIAEARAKVTFKAHPRIDSDGTQATSASPDTPIIIVISLPWAGCFFIGVTESHVTAKWSNERRRPTQGAVREYGR